MINRRPAVFPKEQIPRRRLREALFWTPSLAQRRAFAFSPNSGARMVSVGIGTCSQLSQLLDAGANDARGNSLFLDGMLALKRCGALRVWVRETRE